MTFLGLPGKDALEGLIKENRKTHFEQLPLELRATFICSKIESLSREEIVNAWEKTSLREKKDFVSQVVSSSLTIGENTLFASYFPNPLTLEQENSRKLFSFDLSRNCIQTEERDFLVQLLEITYTLQRNVNNSNFHHFFRGMPTEIKKYISYYRSEIPFANRAYEMWSYAQKEDRISILEDMLCAFLTKRIDIKPNKIVHRSLPPATIDCFSAQSMLPQDIRAAMNKDLPTAIQTQDHQAPANNLISPLSSTSTSKTTKLSPTLFARTGIGLATFRTVTKESGLTCNKM